MPVSKKHVIYLFYLCILDIYIFILSFHIKTKGTQKKYKTHDSSTSEFHGIYI